MQMSRKATPQAQMSSRRAAAPSIRAVSVLSLPVTAGTTTRPTRAMAMQNNKKSPAAIATSTSTTALPAQTTASTPTPTPPMTHRSTLSRAKLEQLVHTLATFRPKGTGEFQFYNYLREFCIVNSCSLEDGIERAPTAWRHLKPQQQRLYETEMRQAMPIPVPYHLVYDALRDESKGRLTLVKYENGRCVIESYSLPMHARHRQRMKAEQRYLAFFGNSNNKSYGDDASKPKCRQKRLTWQISTPKIRRNSKRRHAKPIEKFELSPLPRGNTALSMPMPMPLPGSVKHRLKVPGVTKRPVVANKLKPAGGHYNARKSRAADKRKRRRSGGASGDGSVGASGDDGTSEYGKLRKRHYSLKNSMGAGAGDGSVVNAKSKKQRTHKKKTATSTSIVTPPTAGSRRVTVRKRLSAL